MSLLQRLFSTSLNRLCRTPLLFAADRILRAREVTENVFSREGRVSEERLKGVIQQIVFSEFRGTISLATLLFFARRRR